MIKINLLNPKKRNKVNAKKSSSLIQESKSLDNEDVKKEAFRRILMILIFPICLMLYENLSIPDLHSEISKADKQIKEISEFIAKNSQIADLIKQMQNRENIVALKITEIEKKVAEKNTRVQMLDVLQQLIPERVWLTKLAESDSNVVLSGFAMNESELNTFIEALSKSIVFKEVNIIGSHQVNQEGQSLKKFELSFKLGGKYE